ncbi:MAG: PIN domain-containing protein [Candidatus Lokiarchaeota archaeon]|nr:PIN domain-containing protein [Candidatus Lokiarchaeota archaeon]MBD3338721.1 PIN domain-containing protein [Candidatus Lokiarchaeota archaeon]
MGLLIDTNFIYALHRKNDKNHKAVKKIFKSDIWNSNGPAITSSLVINETYTLAMYRTRFNKRLMNDLDLFFWSEDRFFGILFFSLEDYQETSNIMSKYSTPNRLLSFVDASLIYLGKLRKSDIIISFDSHFDDLLKGIC